MASSRHEMFPRSLKSQFEAIEEIVNNNDTFKSSAKAASLVFGLKSGESDESLIVSIHGGRVKLSLGQSSTAAFTLSARASDWEQFLAPTQKAPFQSYWGILRSYETHSGVQVLGDTVAFASWARVWRLLLEDIRAVVTSEDQSKQVATVPEEDDEEDAIMGRYIRTNTVLWGKSRLFCEYAGTGPQHLLFLHTAGSDSRQYHALMNDRNLQQRCTMYAFDLPGHGRSDLGTEQQIGNLKCDEETYVDTIKQVIQLLKLRRPIVCGASMAGQVCLAVALRASELGVSGVVPCEACEYLPKLPAIYGYDVDESLLNLETVCGMISPSAPAVNKRLIWWSYSSQGKGVFKGDLTFYFEGWDGRGRMGQIDTRTCPVYMLTGEYDYSCTPTISKATADQIPGAVFETMEGMGHFPATEDPKRFLPYLTKALDHIQTSCSGNQAE